MRRCLIITGGTIDLDFAGSFLENERFDKVIAVDAGLERAAALGLVPDLIVGDFDTVKPEILEQYRRMEHIVSVSYTHLDVYKRQRPWLSWMRRRPAAAFTTS